MPDPWVRRGIRAGGDNRFGHPHGEVVQRLEQAIGEHRVYRTADHGDIEFISDGSGLWVKSHR